MDEAVQVAGLQVAEGSVPPAPGLSVHDAADFIAGGIGGACGVAAGQPLDVVRIRQQQPGALGGSLATWLRGIAGAEGARALFRGMSYPLCTSILQNAVVFQSYGAAARSLAAPPPAATAAATRQGSGEPQAVPLLSLGQVFWAGCAAGVVQTAVVVPVDLLKIRLQLQTAVRGSPGYVAPLSLLATVVRTEGLRGLYRGTAITCIRDFPSHGIYFACYEGCRELFEPGSRAAGSDSLWALWAAGGIGGAVSWLSVYPFDVLKSRLQATAAGASPYRGWVHCARQSYAAEGAAAFSRGLSATLGRAFIVNGAIFSAYELSHQLLAPRQRAAA